MLLTILLGLIGFWQIAMFVAIILLVFGGKHFGEMLRGSNKTKHYKETNKQTTENINTNK